MEEYRLDSIFTNFTFMTHAHLIIVLACLLTACATQEDTERSRIKQRKDLLAHCMSFHGEYDDWRSIRSLSFTKEYSLYDDAGHEEKCVLQYITIDRAQDRMSVLSINNADSMLIGRRDTLYYHYARAGQARLPSETIARRLQAASFVMDIPYNIYSTSVQVDHDTISIDDRSVLALHVDYHPSDDQSDLWRYHIDLDSGKILSHWVETSDHYSLIENLSFLEAGGHQWYGKRRSYRTDSLMHKLYLRASYEYFDYEVVR